MKNSAHVYWDKVNFGYSKSWSSVLRQNLSKKELLFIDTYLPNQDKLVVLDVGFGIGRIIDNYLKIKNIDIYGVDQSRKMFLFCNSKYKKKPNVVLKICDLSKKDVPFNKKFDAITAIRVLNYNENWVEIIEKLKKSVKSGGVIIFTFPNKNSLSRFGKADFTYVRTTLNEIFDVCAKLNLEVLDTTTFIRLPNKYYDLSDNFLYFKLISFVEQFLYLLLGKIRFGKIFFVAVKVK